MPPSRIEVIVNQNSGTEGERSDIKTRIEEAFRAHNLEANVSVADNGEELMKLAGQAAKSDAEIIVAGGGDGTVSGVASKIVETEKTLGVLPLGTLNHFAKDLQIPLNLEDAVRVVAENHTKKIDVGEANGRIFINNSSIGLYPQIVKNRERQQERLGRGKWWAAFWAATSILLRYPFFAVRLKVKGEEFIRRTPFVFIGNNEYEMDIFKVGSRRCLDAGRLSLYLLRRTGRLGLLLLALRTVFGALRRAKDFDAFCADEIEIETRRKRVLVAFDGEVALMRSPLRYRSRPSALRVIVPKETEGADNGG